MLVLFNGIFFSCVLFMYFPANCSFSCSAMGSEQLGLVQVLIKIISNKHNSVQYTNSGGYNVCVCLSCHVFLVW